MKDNVMLVHLFIMMTSSGHYLCRVALFSILSMGKKCLNLTYESIWLLREYLAPNWLLILQCLVVVCYINVLRHVEFIFIPVQHMNGPYWLLNNNETPLCSFMDESLGSTLSKNSSILDVFCSVLRFSPFFIQCKNCCRSFVPASTNWNRSIMLTPINSVVLRSGWRSSLTMTAVTMITAPKRFAGHAHWQNVKHTKDANDKEKARLSSHYVRAVQDAVKSNHLPSLSTYLFCRWRGNSWPKVEQSPGLCAGRC